MKLFNQRHLVLCLSLLMVSFSKADAQECDTYFPLTEGAVFEMESFDGSDKKSGRLVYNIQNVKSSGKNKEGNVYAKHFDKKDKMIHESDFSLICEAGKVSVDMKNFIPAASMNAYEGMDMKMEGQNVTYPASLSIGQTLQDATMRMTITDKASGNEMGVVNINIINRKVAGKEKVTTPAGTFDTYKITFELTIETVVMGMRLPGSKSNVVEYISPGVGIIKNETYNQKDKLTGYQLLTKYSK